MERVLNASGRDQKSRIAAALLSATAVMALTACTGPSEGEITDAETPTSSASESAESAFATGLPEDICPAPEVIPDDLAAPASVGYRDESGRRGTGSLPYQQCAYYLDAETRSLDGVQAVDRISLEFYVTDGLPLDLFGTDHYSSVDFDRVQAAGYFRDWDQATDRFEVDVSATGLGLKDSFYVEFEAFASIDNLYVYSYIAFVVVDEDHDVQPDLDVNEAAYRVIEAVVAPVVDELERT